MPTRDAYTDRRVRESDLHGASKATLQQIIKRQKEKWPTLTLGKLSQKTNKATMCAALLDQELGFTVRARALEPVPESQDEGRVQGSSDENPSTVEGVATANDRHVVLAHSNDDRQVWGSPDRVQAAAKTTVPYRSNRKRSRGQQLRKRRLIITSPVHSCWVQKSTSTSQRV
ncbi:hypothetical protein EDB89DRAFT_1152073 [Lactarius sanguifluus]|nr:hypothetical protein EDB89DRAFT_1152073 [Lactarius sanguifluus]